MNHVGPGRHQSLQRAECPGARPWHGGQFCTGPLAKAASLCITLPKSRPLVRLGVRVATELSHNTRRLRASSRNTWWFEVGSSSQSLAKAMMAGGEPKAARV